MQYLDIERASNRQAIKLTQYGFLLAACLILWFNPNTQPFCQQLDHNVFAFLNNGLRNAAFWQHFWGYLNHPHESWLNVIVMVSINILSIATTHPYRRNKTLAEILYFWLAFQIILFATHLIFIDLLNIQRLSPSLVVPNMVNLADILLIPNLRVYSTYSLPAGHTLIAIYWAIFSLRYSKRWLHPFIYLTSTFLILPRLLCGGHWLSDVIFTIVYALICFTAIDGAPFFKSITKYLSKIINLLGIKQHRTAPSL